MVVEQGGVLRSGISVNRNPFLSFESSGNVRRESVLVPSVRCLIFIVDPDPDPETVLHPWKLSWAKRKPATDQPRRASRTNSSAAILDYHLSNPRGTGRIFLVPKKAPS